MTTSSASSMTAPEGTLWFRTALLADGWANDVTVTFKDGLIDAITAGTPRPAETGERAIALPGLPNLHSHAFQRGMSGLTEFRQGAQDDSFWSWRDLLYRFVDRGTPEDIEALTAMAFAEMLEGGFTRVAEFHYLHHDTGGQPYADPAELGARVIRAAAETGIGLTLLPVFYAHSDFGGASPSEGQRRFIHSPDSFSRLVEGLSAHCAALPDAVLGVAPHSLRAVTPDELSAVCGLPGDGPVHIHIAEQMKEVEGCLAWSGARPVEWLFEHMNVDQHWCLVHATHTTEGERSMMAKAGAVAGLCPVTEANLGDGIFDLQHFIAEGGLFGVGTDSNVSISAPDELRILEYGQRLRHQRRNVVTNTASPSTGRALYEGTLSGGNRACGTEGGLAVGMPADIVCLEIATTDLPTERDRLLDAMIFTGHGPRVSEVWRRGRPVVSGGRHIDRERIETRFSAALERLTA